MPDDAFLTGSRKVEMAVFLYLNAFLFRQSL